MVSVKVKKEFFDYVEGRVKELLWLLNEPLEDFGIYVKRATRVIELVGEIARKKIELGIKVDKLHNDAKYGALAKDYTKAFIPGLVYGTGIEIVDALLKKQYPDDWQTYVDYFASIQKRKDALVQTRRFIKRCRGGKL